MGVCNKPSNLREKVADIFFAQLMEGFAPQTLVLAGVCQFLKGQQGGTQVVKGLLVGVGVNFLIQEFQVICGVNPPVAHFCAHEEADQEQSAEIGKGKLYLIIWGRAVDVTFFPFSMTFNTVSHNHLIYVLRHYGLDGWITRCVKN